MERIDELCLFSPLRDKCEWYSEWYHIQDYQKFILCFCGDVMLNLEMQWSCDEKDVKEVMVKVMCASASGLYKYACEKVKLPYVRLCIQNKTGMNNTKIDLNFYGLNKVEKKKVVFNDVISDPLPSVSTDSPRGLLFNNSEPEKSRFRSPFKKATERKSSLSTPPKKCIPTRDQRLPEISLPHALLIGEKGGNWRQLPHGLPSQILTMTPDGPAWTFPYPKPDEWKLKD